MGCSPPGSSVLGISQTRILEWVVISFSRGFSQPKDGTHMSCIGRWILYHWDTRKAFVIVCFVLVTELCLTLCDPVDYSLPEPSVHGTLQARILESVAESFTRGSFDPGIEPRSLALASGLSAYWVTREALVIVQASAKCYSWNSQR